MKILSTAVLIFLVLISVSCRENNEKEEAIKAEIILMEEETEDVVKEIDKEAADLEAAIKELDSI